MDFSVQLHLLPSSHDISEPSIDSERLSLCCIILFIIPVILTFYMKVAPLCWSAVFLISGAKGMKILLHYVELLS